MSEQDETPQPEPGQDVTVQAGLASAAGAAACGAAPEPGQDDEGEG